MVAKLKSCHLNFPPRVVIFDISISWNRRCSHGATEPGEKRNATEIMHAYVGSGLEVLSDKGGEVGDVWSYVDAVVTWIICCLGIM